MSNSINPIFTQPRETTDTDMISEVREMLRSSGLNHELVSAYDTHQYIIDASTLRPEAQRFLLNRYWNIQLISFGIETSEERYCLLDCGDYTEWLRLFRTKILPTAVRLRLPKIIT